MLRLLGVMMVLDEMRDKMVLRHLEAVGNEGLARP